jgi:hypothetical protein
MPRNDEHSAMQQTIHQSHVLACAIKKNYINGSTLGVINSVRKIMKNLETLLNWQL